MLSAFISALIAVLAPCLPSPDDRDGLGLRIRLDRDGPLLQYESIGSIGFDVTLINFSKEIREHDALVVALTTGDLRLRITGPDGKGLGSIRGQSIPRDPFTVMHKLRPGESASDRFGFGYHRVVQAGRYRAVATMKIDGKELASPPIEFEVVKVPDGAILASHNLPREGVKPQPGEQQERAAVEQVRVGDRVWLVHRRFGSLGGLIFARRLAELPGKCEMAVEGVYGEWGPLTIAYKTSPTAEPTKLVINSINGLLWTEEEERSWQERLREKNGLPPLAPSPRPIKP
jgi:hypothetical protein